MHANAAAIVAAARGCVGTAFRAQGRLPGIGLDCVGVALVALAAAGRVWRPPPYSLGGDHAELVDDLPAAIGCRRVDTADPGDLLVLAPAPTRRHLAIVTPAGAVHAHAGLARVVEGPVARDWTIIAAWRLPEGD